MRASINGASAATGKFGAIIGAIAFAPFAREYGLAVTFFILGVVAVAGEIRRLGLFRV